MNILESLKVTDVIPKAPIICFNSDEKLVNIMKVSIFFFSSMFNLYDKDY